MRCDLVMWSYKPKGGGWISIHFFVKKYIFIQDCTGRQILLLLSFNSCLPAPTPKHTHSQQRQEVEDNSALTCCGFAYLSGCQYSSFYSSEDDS